MSRARRMHRALALVTLAAAATVAAATPVAATPTRAVDSRPRAAETDEATPLTVQMTGMNPAVIPAEGVLRIRGLVTNDSDEEWTDVSVAPFVSSAPITTRDELAAVVDTPEEEAVGSRLPDPTTYVKVGDLPPGQSRNFAITVPRESLVITGEPGVYWIGVHALGSNVDGRDLVADGRARTFIPLVSPEQTRGKSVDVSLILPFRERARRAANGSLNGPGRWEGLTAPDGRLSRLADLAASAGDAPVTWEVDPAVLDALDDLGRGNPALSLGSEQRATQPDASPGASPSASADTSSDTSPSPAPSDSDGSQDAAEEPDDALAVRARRVLTTFRDAVAGKTLLTMPYGDPDVAAVLRDRPTLLTRAQTLAAARMSAQGLQGTAAVAPPDATFDPDLVSALSPSTALVLRDRGRLDAESFTTMAGGQPLVLTDDRASAGGPAPTGAADPLALRQRILSEAALDLDEQRPIVVRFPMRWEPGAHWREADLFSVLRRSWIRLVPVSLSSTTTFDGELSYGKAQRSQEIAADNVADTGSLVRTGDTLANLLANASADDVRQRLAGAAFQASAYSARTSPGLAADQVRELDSSVRSTMGRVKVTGTDFVTLSGGSGTLTVTLVNGLDQPIDVGLRTRTGTSDVEVESSEPVQLAPGQRTTLPLSIRSTAGLHEVSMFPVTRNDQLLGTPLTFSVRTTQVGVVIWYVIAGGLGLLFVMILRRIVLRIRNRRWRLEEAP